MVGGFWMDRQLRIRAMASRTGRSTTRYRATAVREATPGEVRPDEQQETGRVTRRQLEVLCLLATGLTISEAAKRLLISEHTVIRHVTNMGMIVGAGNRLELLALASIGGFIDADHWPPEPTGHYRRAAPNGRASPRVRIRRREGGPGPRRG